MDRIPIILPCFVYYLWIHYLYFKISLNYYTSKIGMLLLIILKLLYSKYTFYFDTLNCWTFYHIFSPITKTSTIFFWHPRCAKHENNYMNSQLRKYYYSKVDFVFIATLSMCSIPKPAYTNCKTIECFKLIIFIILSIKLLFISYYSH